MNDDRLEAGAVDERNDVSRAALRAAARQALGEATTRTAAAYVATRIGETVQLAILMPGAIVVLVLAAIACGIGWFLTDETLGRLLPQLDGAIGVFWLGAFAIMVFLGIRWLVTRIGRRVQQRLDAAFAAAEPTWPDPLERAQLLDGGGARRVVPGSETQTPVPTPPPTLAELDARLAPPRPSDLDHAASDAEAGEPGRISAP